MSFIRKNLMVIIGVCMIFTTILFISISLKNVSQPTIITSVTDQYHASSNGEGFFYQTVQAETKDGNMIALNIKRKRASQMPGIGDAISVEKTGSFYKESDRYTIPVLTYIPGFIGSLLCIRKYF